MFSFLLVKPYLSLNKCVLGRSLSLKIPGRESNWYISKLIQMLLYRGSLIKPHVPLQDYGLMNGDCVSLLVKGIEGGRGVVWCSHTLFMRRVWLRQTSRGDGCSEDAMLVL